MSPAAALDRLMKGNARYVEGVSRRHDFKNEREALVGGQNPFASILSCADSRIAPEYAFDSGRGDLFVCRVAGNFANDDTVASLEYGVAVLNSPLILVLGHDSCGAVDATIKSLKDNTTLPGHLPSLVNALAPAVKAVEDQPGDKLANAMRQNVIDVIARLKSATPILSAAAAEGKIKIVGGIYRLDSGKVEWSAERRSGSMICFTAWVSGLSRRSSKSERRNRNPPSSSSGRLHHNVVVLSIQAVLLIV